MTEIRKAGETNSLGDIDVPQKEFRKQIDALTDAVRQLGGNPTIEPGSTVVNDPLSAPYILYVNSYTGSDKFVAGDYASADDGEFDTKMRRISNQRLECGYTEARPFRTINRAVIEAGIITSRDYLNLGNICGDLVTIVVMSGMHGALNGPGGNVSAWSDGYEPSESDLEAFNSDDGGIVLPRGCSLVSLDLRKTNIYPTYVPDFGEEGADYGNRSAIFRVTGTGYYYGFTFLDKIKGDGTVLERSHHLLDCFAYAGVDRTDVFYQKIIAAFGAYDNYIDSALAVTRSSETQIVGPQPLPGLQDQATDTVQSASPYIYNCSIRSMYGLCGIFANGADVTGFKSMVVAQFTGVSLQKDMSCWQIYNAGNWGPIRQSEYKTYIDESPDNVRMDPRYRSFHIRCVNRAIIQEVSVFAIGQGVHHWVESGGELTVTNSNSNFGGCAAIAEGFVDYSFDTDKNWNVSEISVSEDISGLFGNSVRISLGTCANTSNNPSVIKLTKELKGDENLRPDVLDIDGFSLDNYGGDSYIWIENPSGKDYYAKLADDAWVVSSPDEINITGRLQTPDGEFPTNQDPELPAIESLNVYVRRLRDTRTLDQRANTLLCTNTSTDSRNMIRDYGLQTDTDEASINSEIDAEESVIVASVGVTKKGVGGLIKRANRIELRRGSASAAWDANGHWEDSQYKTDHRFFRVGDVVIYENKHWKCVKENDDTTFDTEKWDECLVHTREDFAAEDYFKNSKPIIVFDKDLDPTGEDSFLGYDPTECFMDDEQVRAQHRTSTDYLGLYSFLRSLGFNASRAHRILAPKPAADRVVNPSIAFDNIPKPDGAASTWSNWAVQLRRPSNIRLFGHAFEWAGQLNYSKALPQYQRDLSASNKFSYFFTNSMGGRCYVSGFNEEGFGVSAAGLTDLQTGETLDPGGIGGERDPNSVTVFTNVKVTGTLEADTIKSEQLAKVRWLNDLQIPPFERLTGEPTGENDETKGKGFAWAASFKNITGFSSQIDYEPQDVYNQKGESEDQAPHFVSPYYLDSWRVANRLVSSRLEPLEIFVNPRGVAPVKSDKPVPENNESRNWDKTNLVDILKNPPTSAGNAVRSLQLAKEFADISVGTLTPIKIFLGPGLYIHEPDDIVFEHPTTIRTWDFVNDAALNDNNYGGTKPFFGCDLNNGSGKTDDDGIRGHSALQGDELLTYFTNSDHHPVFLTRVFVQQARGNRPYLRTKPLSLEFKKESYVAGVVWWGVNESLANAQGTQSDADNRIPNDFFRTQDSDLSDTVWDNIRNSGDARQLLNAFVDGWITRYGDKNFQYYRSAPCLRSHDRVNIQNVAIGAVGLPFSNGGRNEDCSVFRSVNGGIIRTGGLYLIGNCIWDSSGSGAEWRGDSTFSYQGFSQSLLSADKDFKDAPVRFAWGGQTKKNAGGGSYIDWNLPCNNLHLLTNEGKYMDKDLCCTVSSSFGTGNAGDVPLKHGPGFRFLFGQYTKVRVRLNTQEHFHAGWINKDDSRRQGIAGYFGLIKKTTDNVTTIQFTLSCRAGGLAAATEDNSQGDTDTRFRGEETLYAGTEIFYDNDYCVFQQNGRERPDPPKMRFLAGDSDGKDAPIYAARWDGSNPGQPSGYMHPKEFKAVGMPFVSDRDTMNVKAFVGMPRISFNDGISCNQQAYI